MSLEVLFDAAPYGVSRAEKHRLLLAELNALCAHHVDNCGAYASILRAYDIAAGKAETLADIPFIPVRLFKTHDLLSVPMAEVFKTMTSSGTTGQVVSRIYLDRETSQLQTRAMVKIMQSFIGKARLPMLIIDCPAVVKNRDEFSARGAGILGMANFGRKHCYVLRDEDMSIDFDALEAFLDGVGGGPALVFGFTFMIWQYLVKALERAGRRIEFPEGILVHSGGWKKLQDQAVDNVSFKAAVAKWTGIEKIYNFYGMVEQVGSIFVECEFGRLHAPVFSEVIVRDPINWKPVAFGAEGVIQVVSCLPRSYPGHSLLTEDKGRILGEDDCECGRYGRYFEVTGRLPMAELRGCSDTHAAEAA